MEYGFLLPKSCTTKNVSTKQMKSVYDTIIVSICVTVQQHFICVRSGLLTEALNIAPLANVLIGGFGIIL